MSESKDNGQAKEVGQAVQGRKIDKNGRRPEVDQERPKSGHFVQRQHDGPPKRIHNLVDQLETADIDVFSLSHPEMKTLIEYIYTNLGILDDLTVHIAVFRTYMDEIEKCYRNDNYFHNFRHCFCVTQMMYNVLRKTQLDSKFTAHELAALITSCVCHDLDHPGMNNDYQQKAKTELYTTFGDSTLERHHLAVTKRILKRRCTTPPNGNGGPPLWNLRTSNSDNSITSDCSVGSMSLLQENVDVEQVLQYYQDKENPEYSKSERDELESEEEKMAWDQERLDKEGGKARESAMHSDVWEKNIFNVINEEDQESIMEMIEGLILCTDMKGHKEYVDKFEKVSENFDFEEETHKKLLMKILVKACDISNEVRTTEVSEKWCVQLLKEYFAQSDYEKSKGIPHLPWFDRDTQTKSAAQINFIEKTLMPIYQLLSAVFPELEECSRNLSKNLKFYQDLQNDPIRDNKDLRKEPLPRKED